MYQYHIHVSPRGFHFLLQVQFPVDIDDIVLTALQES
jgi:hypothetical protein